MTKDTKYGMERDIVSLTRHLEMTEKDLDRRLNYVYNKLFTIKHFLLTNPKVTACKKDTFQGIMK